MKITKGRIKEIIKEELARTYNETALPQELVSSWEEAIHDFIDQQFAHGADPTHEAPAIAQALQNVASTLQRGGDVATELEE